MDQHVTTEVPYYTSTQTVIPTPSSSSNLLFQPQEPQYHVQGYPPQQQAQYVMPYNTMENQPMVNTGQYPSIDFFYETPQPDYTNTSAPNYQIPTNVRCYTSCHSYKLTLLLLFLKIDKANRKKCKYNTIKCRRRLRSKSS